MIRIIMYSVCFIIGIYQLFNGRAMYFFLFMALPLIIDLNLFCIYMIKKSIKKLKKADNKYYKFFETHGIIFHLWLLMFAYFFIPTILQGIDTNLYEYTNNIMMLLFDIILASHLLYINVLFFFTSCKVVQIVRNKTMRRRHKYAILLFFVYVIAIVAFNVLIYNGWKGIRIVSGIVLMFPIIFATIYFGYLEYIIEEGKNLKMLRNASS